MSIFAKRMRCGMREILFRGKREDNGEWVEGFYWKDLWGDGESCYILYDSEDFCVNQSTVGQYTGLHDKNGKRIFEGDIIRAHYANAKRFQESIEQIVFHNGRFCALYEADGATWRSPIPDNTHHHGRDVYMDWCEVIGNIHDEPELLDRS